MASFDVDDGDWGDLAEDVFVPFDPAEEWEIAMEESARDDYLADASMFDDNQIFSRNL